MLRKFLLRAGHGGQIRGEDDRTRRGRALINRQKRGRHRRYTQRKTANVQINEMMSPPHKGSPMMPSQARKMKALPNSEMNSRSPRVVSRPKTPWRGEPPGEDASEADMATKQARRNRRKAPVGEVDAIQERSVFSCIMAESP